MGIDSYITDPQDHKNAHIVTHDDIDNNNALVVATHPLKKYENTIRFFTSSVYGIDMNIGITIDTSITEYIHNGTDDAYWTASIIQGDKWTIANEDQNHTAGGSHSIKYDNGDTNDTLQIAKSSNINLTNYNNLIMWIYVDKDWKAGDSISTYGWDTTGGTIVGNSVDLEDYFTWNNYDEWQKITIPLSDMALTGETLNAIRIEITDEEGKSPKMYLDDIFIEGISGDSGSEVGAGEFSIEPDQGTWLHVHDFSYIMADDDYDSTQSDGTVPKIPYNTLLGVDLSTGSGILYQREIDGEIKFSIIIKQLSDILQLAGAEIAACGSLGATGTWITIKNKILEPIILKSENHDKLKFVVNDNLSGLDLIRITAACKIEYRQ